jgi:hypothetical protein
MGGVQKLRQLRAGGYYSHSLHLLLKSVGETEVRPKDLANI